MHLDRVGLWRRSRLEARSAISDETRRGQACTLIKFGNQVGGRSQFVPDGKLTKLVSNKLFKFRRLAVCA